MAPAEIEFRDHYSPIKLSLTRLVAELELPHQANGNRDRMGAATERAQTNRLGKECAPE